MKYTQHVHQGSVFYKTEADNATNPRQSEGATSNILNEIDFQGDDILPYEMVFVGKHVVNSLLDIPFNDKEMGFLINCHNNDYEEIIQNIYNKIKENYSDMILTRSSGHLIVKNDKFEMEFLHTLSIEDTVKNFNIPQMRAYFDGKNIFYHESAVNDCRYFPNSNKLTINTSYTHNGINYII